MSLPDWSESLRPFFRKKITELFHKLKDITFSETRCNGIVVHGQLGDSCPLDCHIALSFVCLLLVS